MDAEVWVPVPHRVSLAGCATFVRSSGEGLLLNGRTFAGEMQTVTFLPGTILTLSI